MRPQCLWLFFHLKQHFQSKVNKKDKMKTIINGLIKLKCIHLEGETIFFSVLNSYQLLNEIHETWQNFKIF